MNEITATKRIVKGGNALCVNVTKECRILNLESGDAVEITIRKLQPDK